MEEQLTMKINLENNKKFEKPELEIIVFTAEEDIITSSFGDPDPKPGDINGGGNGWW